MYALTPGEVSNRMDAWIWTENRTLEREAWKLAHLLSPHSKKALTPKMFLSTPAPSMTFDEKMTELSRRLEKKHG